MKKLNRKSIIFFLVMLSSNAPFAPSHWVWSAGC